MTIQKDEFQPEIERIRNLLDTSVDEAERKIIRKLLAEEKIASGLQASDSKKK
jgi:hypothetical protein